MGKMIEKCVFGNKRFTHGNQHICYWLGLAGYIFFDRKDNKFINHMK